ncbi:MAG: hypothetical protein QME52_14465, partial [Bacteroidota bacterium]|nr:hypothetical protein [Bacteroidota bacterium]
KQKGTLWISSVNTTPLLLSPIDSAINQSTFTIFRWSDDECKENYHLQVAGDSLFNQIIFNDSLVAVPMQRVCLSYNSSYYWRVAIRYSDGLRSGWSNVWQLTTAAPVDSLQWEFLGCPYCGLWYANELSMAVHPENDSIIFVGIGSDFSAGQQGKIFKTTNLGMTWNTIIEGVTVTTIVINQQNPEIVYVGLEWANYTPPGIIKTTDGGGTWFWSDYGIYVDWETGPVEIEIDPHNPDTMFAGTKSIYPTQGKIYKTTNAGSQWFRPTMSDSLTGNISVIAIHPETTSIVFAARGVIGHLFRSSDGGVNWSQNSLSSDTTTIDDVEFDPVNTNILYAILVRFNFVRIIYKTSDGGINWFKLSNGLPALGYYDIVTSLCPERILLIARYGVYQSTNQGDSWLPITLPSSNWIDGAALSRDGSYLYLAIWNAGIFRTRLITK